MTTALEGHDRIKGVITMTQALGGVLYMTAGDTQWRVFGGDVGEDQRALYELLDNHLIVRFSTEDGPAGYIVTPLGCEIAWAAR